jgi:hypothetical protein
VVLLRDSPTAPTAAFKGRRKSEAPTVAPKEKGVRARTPVTVEGYPLISLSERQESKKFDPLIANDAAFPQKYRAGLDINDHFHDANVCE